MPCVPEERLYKRDEIQLRGDRAQRGGDDRLELLAGVPLPRQEKGNMAILQSGTAVPGPIRLREVKALFERSLQARAGEEQNIARPMSIGAGTQPAHARV